GEAQGPRRVFATTRAQARVRPPRSGGEAQAQARVRPPRSGGEAQDGPSTESSGMIRPSTRPDLLQIELATGLLAGVRQVLSPHFDARPKGVAPDLIVVHGITLPPGEFGGPWIDHMFAGDLEPDAHPLLREHAALRVSAHAVIRRDGVITQYV